MYDLDEPIEQAEPFIVTKDDLNPKLCSPYSGYDITFKQTKESLADPDRYKMFLKNIERRFRASKEYKMYKSYLMDLGLDHCQVMGNIESGDNVDIELHHNILNLFDICILISEHLLNTVGEITTFDIIQLLIYEHFSNNVGVVFLSTTVHEMYTNDPNAYIPPSMTFGKWWVLLEKYKYGITYDIANKLIRYINKYRNEIPMSIKIIQNEQILNYAYLNQYGISCSNQKLIPERTNYDY